MWERLCRRDLDFLSRDAEVPPTFLLRLADFMLHGCDFALHFTHPDPAFHAARPVEEINDSAGQTAYDHDQKTQRTN